MTGDGEKPQSRNSPKAPDGRRERLAAELRANLRRRKAQAKARRTGAATDMPDMPDDGQGEDDRGR